MSRLFLFLTFLFISLGQSYGQSETQLDRVAAVENNLMPYVPVKGFQKWNILERMKYYGIPGLSLAVIKDYKIEYVKSYGFADTLLRKEVTPETIFSAGSISKLVTACIVMKMVDEGLVDLDKPINHYLKSWKLEENELTINNPVTLRKLLSHTAGTSQSSYWGFLPTKSPLPTLVEILSGSELAESRPVVVNSEPGKEWRYSGGGYMIVQMAIMDVLKEDFNSIATQYIFTPLGMENSTFQQPLPTDLLPKFANGYSNASWYKGVPYVYPQQAAAGLHSTSADLALLIIGIQNSLKGEGFLSHQSAKEMITPEIQISRGNFNEDMGVGAFLLEKTGNTSPDGRYFEHQGANAGFISFAMGSVANGNGVVIMMNSGDDFNGFGMELRRSVAQVYEWENFLLDEIEPISLTSEALNEYEGRFRKGPDEVVYIKQENDYLIEKINEGRDIYTFLTAKDTLVFTDYNVTGYFGRDEQGRVVSVRNMYQTPEQAMPRMTEDEFSPSEHLKAKRYDAAKEGFRKMNMNEYQITYLAYEIMNKKFPDFVAVKTILDLALETHPNSAIVYSRLGEYFVKIGNLIMAKESFQKSLALDPNDLQTKESLNELNLLISN